jgi:hypothetical protein
MTYRRGARVEWSFGDWPIEWYEQDPATQDWSFRDPWYREDFATVEEAEAFAESVRQEAKQRGSGYQVSVSDLDAIYRMFEDAIRDGIIPDRRRRKK